MRPLLDAASRALFGRPYAPDPARLAARIEALAAAERYPAGVSGFVRLELTPEGGERLARGRHVPLRRVRPAEPLARRPSRSATTRCCPEAPTSAREAAELLAARLAALRGAAACRALRRGGAAAHGRRRPIVRRARTHGVHRPRARERRTGCLARGAVRAAGLTLREEPLRTPRAAAGRRAVLRRPPGHHGPCTLRRAAAHDTRRRTRSRRRWQELSPKK